MRNWCCLPSPKKSLSIFTFKRRLFRALPKFVVIVSTVTLILLLPIDCLCSNSDSGSGKSEMLKKSDFVNNALGEVTVQSNAITLTLNKISEPRNTRKKEEVKIANSTGTATPKYKGTTTKQPDLGHFEKRSSSQKPKRVTSEIPSSTTEVLEVGGLAFDDAETEPEENVENETATSFDSLPSSEEEESEHAAVLPPTSSSTLATSTHEMDDESVENEMEEEDDPSSEENDVSTEEEVEEEEYSTNLEIPPSSTIHSKDESHMISSSTSTTPGGFVAFASTARSASDDDFPPLFKKLRAGPKTKTRTTRRPPKKVIKPGKFKSTTTPRPPTPVPELFNPHHPHGIVVFDKRKKRPKPYRKTTTTTTTPKTTTQGPEFHEDYYEYEWTSSGENLFPDESNVTTTTPSTNSTKRPKKKVPFSKLALAMVAQSAVFKNGSSQVPPDFPKNPVNLLNILQAYTKQLQMQITKNGTEDPVTIKPATVHITSQPFMVQLNSLNFAAKIGISIYYSLIAIIPLVYLAFGGLGRLGFLNAISGRQFTKKKRRKRRSFRPDLYYQNRDKLKSGYYYHHQQNTPQQGGVKRIDLNEDEYARILGRISEIILEFTIFSSDEE